MSWQKSYSFIALTIGFKFHMMFGWPFKYWTQMILLCVQNVKASPCPLRSAYMKGFCNPGFFDFFNRQKAGCKKNYFVRFLFYRSDLLPNKCLLLAQIQYSISRIDITHTSMPWSIKIAQKPPHCPDMCGAKEKQEKRILHRSGQMMVEPHTTEVALKCVA